MTCFRSLHQAELYNEYAAEDKLLSFQEFNELYKELSSDVFEDAYLEDYVKAVFRAFDGDEDGQLTFKEWRMGYLFLLLLDKEGGGPRTDPADWTKGMEAIYRCCFPFTIFFRVYDVDGDKMLTRAEVEHITKVFSPHRVICLKVLTEPIVAGRLYGGMMDRLAEEVAKIPEETLDKGMTEQDFLDYFTIVLPK